MDNAEPISVPLQSDVELIERVSGLHITLADAMALENILNKVALEMQREGFEITDIATYMSLLAREKWNRVAYLRERGELEKIGLE
jgi:hypothetical protein